MRIPMKKIIKEKAVTYLRTVLFWVITQRVVVVP
jgi:hypothetical protein